MATLTKYPTANTPTTGFDGSGINPTYAYTDDTLYATLVPSKPRNDEDAHLWHGFDFSSIPAGSTINSVTVKAAIKVSASWTQGEWRGTLWEDCSSAAAKTTGYSSAIGATNYTRGTTDTSEYLWDWGTLGTEPTLAQLQATNFGVRLVADQGNNSTSHTFSVDYISITVDYTPLTAPSIEQKAFRFRSYGYDINVDNGWLAALNTDLTDVDVTDDLKMQVRVVLENDGDAALPSTADYLLEYRVNAGTWYVVSGGSGVTVGAAVYANGAATTQLIGSSGSFNTGSGASSTHTIVNRLLSVSYETEMEFCFTLENDELSGSDVIDFRVMWRENVEAWNAPDVVTQTPSITVVKSTPAVRMKLKGSLDPASSSGHKITVRHRGTSSGTAEVRLMESTSERASFPITVTTSWGQTQYSLTGTEADSIGNYDDLDIEIEEDAPSLDGWLQISQVYMELSSDDDKDGTGAITQTHSVTATGKKAVSGTATIVHGHSVVATGAGFETHSGTAAIVQTHSVTATGDAAEHRSGSASIIHTHTATAAGDSAEAHSGSASIVHTHSVVATGIKKAAGAASVVETHSVDANGAAARVGSGSVVQGHSVTATGVKADGDDRSGSGAITQGHSVVAVGKKAAAGTGAISHGHSVTATGIHAEAASGTGSITHGHTATATGVKNADGAGSIVHNHSVTATGVKDDGGNDKSGSGSITQGHTVTASGTKGAKGTASVTQGHSAVATGDGFETHSGTATITQGHTVVATGAKGATGAGTVAQGHSVTATGVKDDSDDRSGSGSIAHTGVVTASGRKDATGAGTIAATHSVVATGQGFEAHAGTAAIVHGHTVVATGVKVSGDHHSGSASITTGHTVSGSGSPARTAQAVIAVPHAVTAVGVSAEFHAGSAAITAVSSVGGQGRGALPSFVGPHSPLSLRVAIRTRGWP